VVNSFSKYFSMTGWRVGWLVVPPELVRPIERLTQNFFISVPTLSQHAALAASIAATSSTAMSPLQGQPRPADGRACRRRASTG
jgi:aspartate/methionine/tyrosine aminotransferase